MVSRRGFIKGSGLALVGLGLSGGIPAFALNAARSEKKSGPYKKTKTLVCIFQRGAMDGLMAITPFTDSYLQSARPGLFISAASGALNDDTRLIDLDGRFGMHPMFKSLEPFYRDGTLAIVHGIGSPNKTRSHFDAQDYMESGTPFSKATTSGWLNRATGLLNHDHVSPFQTVSFTSALPRALYGDASCIAISNLQDFALRSTPGTAAIHSLSSGFEDLYDQTVPGLLQQTGKESFDAMKLIQQSDVKNYRPDNQASYPSTSLGNALKQIAQLIKMNVGLEIAFTEHGGWDTHFNQGASTGIFGRNAADLGNSIAAFWTDLSSYQDEVTVMTMTEFGRTVHQNGTGGTDHGRASCNFILGNQAYGGKIHGNIQPLAKENLEDGRDLPVTTDFRSVFSEVADRHLGIQDDHVLFPDWTGKSIGVMKSS